MKRTEGIVIVSLFFPLSFQLTFSLSPLRVAVDVAQLETIENWRADSRLDANDVLVRWLASPLNPSDMNMIEGASHRNLSSTLAFSPRLGQELRLHPEGARVAWRPASKFFQSVIMGPVGVAMLAYGACNVPKALATDPNGTGSRTFPFLNRDVRD